MAQTGSGRLSGSWASVEPSAAVRALLRFLEALFILLFEYTSIDYIVQMRLNAIGFRPKHNVLFTPF
jgi:hypothetical protein